MKSEDAYGHEMWAYFKDKESFEIVERDDGYSDALPGVSESLFFKL